jgi:hypothetical protein
MAFKPSPGGRKRYLGYDLEYSFYSQLTPSDRPSVSTEGTQVADW